MSKIYYPTKESKVWKRLRSRNAPVAYFNIYPQDHYISSDFDIPTIAALVASIDYKNNRIKIYYKNIYGKWIEQFINSGANGYDSHWSISHYDPHLSSNELLRLIEQNYEQRDI